MLIQCRQERRRRGEKSIDGRKVRSLNWKSKAESEVTRSTEQDEHAWAYQSCKPACLHCSTQLGIDARDDKYYYTLDG